MNVCVAGAGTIGSLLAAHLGRVADVSVLVRREEHARALNKDGLRVSGRADFTARVTSGLKAEAFDDLRPAQWSKLIFNATVNGVAALTGLPHDASFGTEPLGPLVHALIEEGKAAAAAAGVELWEDPWDMNLLATKR